MVEVPIWSKEVRYERSWRPSGNRVARQRTHLLHRLGWIGSSNSLRKARSRASPRAMEIVAKGAAAAIKPQVLTRIERRRFSKLKRWTERTEYSCRISTLSSTASSQSLWELARSLVKWLPSRGASIGTPSLRIVQRSS